MGGFMKGELKLQIIVISLHPRGISNMSRQQNYLNLFLGLAQVQKDNKEERSARPTAGESVTYL